MIERLYVHNFRGLDNFTLSLAGHPSALLIGRNGSGKSTVRQCLELFQSIGRRNSRRVHELISPGAFTQHRTDIPMKFEIELVLGRRRFTYAISFDWPETFRAARIVDESLSADGTSVFARHHADVQLAGGATFGLDWHTVALPVVNVRPDNTALQTVKAFLASMILTAPVPALMAGFSDEPSLELDMHATNLASCLSALLTQKPAVYRNFDTYVRGVITDFFEVEFVPRGESGYQLVVKFGEATDPLSVDFNALSDGEKCFILSAYVVALNSAGSPVFCMWDEPDNHLSLPEVSQFITRLRKMTNQGGQFLATSHHPEAIRRFSDETTFVLTRTGHLAPSVVRPLTELPRDGDLIGALLRDEIIGTAVAVQSVG